VLDLDAPMDLSAFNAPFDPARTEYDWLSRDPAQVDRHVQTRSAASGSTAGGKAMFLGSHEVGRPERPESLRRDLPVHVAVGEHDPVNGQLALVDALVDRMRTAGMQDVTLKVYPEARHEVFNETNRDEVVADLLAWLDSHLPIT
jgi:alpha-beta hydrolase superfamily lysophospholipase